MARRSEATSTLAAQSLPQQPELPWAAPAAPAVPSDRDDEATSDAPDERTHDGLCSPFILSDEHMRRLLDGSLRMTGPTATWAHLLRRSHDIDITACPKCHGRLRLMAVVRDREQVRRFLSGSPGRLLAPGPPPDPDKEISTIRLFRRSRLTEQSARSGRARKLAETGSAS